MDIEKIYVSSCDPGRALDIKKWSELFVDTSCSYVPFGFVRLVRASLQEIDSPETFWSACLSSDSNVNMLSATIKNGTLDSLASTMKVIFEDLARVGEPNAYKPVDEFKECLIVESGCSNCCGSILLIRGNTEVVYLHWHRES